LFFFAGLFAKPAGTSKKIKIKSPTPRTISRNMNVNLREQQDQNDTVIALSIGPFSMIPFPGARFLDTEPPTNSFGQRTVVIIYVHYMS
jgi:hypothetical protein